MNEVEPRSFEGVVFMIVWCRFEAVVVVCRGIRVHITLDKTVNVLA